MGIIYIKNDDKDNLWSVVVLQIKLAVPVNTCNKPHLQFNYNDYIDPLSFFCGVC